MTDDKKILGENPEKKSKNACEQTTGAWTWFRRHEMPPGNEDVEAELKDFYERIIAMYCPDGKLNAHQEKLLQRAVHKLGFCILSEKAVWRQGPIQQNEKGQPEMLPSIGKQYFVCDNQFRLIMREFREISVGKGKKSSLEDYLEKEYGDKAKKG